MRGVFVLLNVIEFVSETRQVLGLNNIRNVIGLVSILSIGEAGVEVGSVVGDTWMFLNSSGLIDVGFSEFFNCFWG